MRRLCLALMVCTLSTVAFADPPAERPAPAKLVPFGYSVVQDGAPVAVTGGRAFLQRRPFRLIFSVPDHGTIMLNASQNPKLHNAAQARQPVEKIIPLGGTGMAEAAFNKEKELMLSDGGYHYLYYSGPKDHRYDHVREDGAGIVATRKVEKLYGVKGKESEAIAGFDGKNLFLVMIKIHFDSESLTYTPLQVEALELVFQ